MFVAILLASSLIPGHLGSQRFDHLNGEAVPILRIRQLHVRMPSKRQGDCEWPVAMTTTAGQVPTAPEAMKRDKRIYHQSCARKSLEWTLARCLALKSSRMSRPCPLPYRIIGFT